MPYIIQFPSPRSFPMSDFEALFGSYLSQEFTDNCGHRWQPFWSDDELSWCVRFVNEEDAILALLLIGSGRIEFTEGDFG